MGLDTFRVRLGFIMSVLAMLCLLLSPPAEAFADSIDDARDAGVEVGVGLPMLIWGGLGTIGSMIGFFGTEEPGFSEYFILGFSVAQIGTGIALLVVGESNRPSEQQALETQAFSAGQSIGSGATLTAYGSLIIVNALIRGITEERDGYGWMELSLELVVGGLQVGFGAYNLSQGLENFDDVRRRADASRSAGTPLTMPVFHHSF